MLDQFTSSDMDAFYARWNLGARAKGKSLGTLRGFFRFYANREWLTKSPVTSPLRRGSDSLAARYKQWTASSHLSQASA
jgi:hypothetical protein